VRISYGGDLQTPLAEQYTPIGPAPNLRGDGGAQNGREHGFGDEHIPENRVGSITRGNRYSQSYGPSRSRMIVVLLGEQVLARLGPVGRVPVVSDSLGEKSSSGAPLGGFNWNTSRLGSKLIDCEQPSPRIQIMHNTPGAEPRKLSQFWREIKIPTPSVLDGMAEGTRTPPNV
jgi:hypothetical protein